MYDPISPVHPTYELARYQLRDPARQVVEMTPLYPPPAGPDSDDPSTDIDTSKSIDELLLASRRGLESVAGDITHLLDERRRDGAEIIAGIDRDQLYLDNLILDRYRHGERATDDQTGRWHDVGSSLASAPVASELHQAARVPTALRLLLDW